MTCPEDDLVRDFVKRWREVVQPRPTDAECWRLDRQLRDKYGGRKHYVKKLETVERERRKSSR